MSAWLINPPSSGTWAFSLRLAPYCRSCPCDRHDPDLPSIPASLQTLGRCECVATCALALLGLRIISPLTFYLSFLGAIWTYDKKNWLRSFSTCRQLSRISHGLLGLSLVASHVLRSFEFDGQKFFIHCVQSNSIQFCRQNLSWY